MHHIHLSHIIWKDFLRPGMIVVDATCGNGHDTLCLAKLVLGPKTGKVFGIDLQESAIKNTSDLLKRNLSPALFQRVSLIHGSHEDFPNELKQANLIVYNFGYLPKGDPFFTTKTATSIASCKNALPILSNGGMLSLTLYSGHAEGKIESIALLDWAMTLSKEAFSISIHSSYKKNTSPTLVFIRKIKTQLWNT